MVALQNIHFGYGKGKALFSGLNLELKAGNVYGLLGKNGAGKTSLLRIIGGLLFPHEGQCLVGAHIAAQRNVDFLREVFFIPEEFDLPNISIRKYIKANAPFYPRFDDEQFDRYLAEFELGDHLKLTELSHGQKKKVFTGFALSTNVSLLIMDEPTNGLDIPSKAQFRRLIASALNENRTVIISTHQVRDLDTLIDPIIILDQRNILLHASLERIGEKLYFGTVNSADEIGETALYSEPSVRGISFVRPADGQLTNKVDLELLFNAALQEPQRLAKLFQ